VVKIGAALGNDLEKGRREKDAVAYLYGKWVGFELVLAYYEETRRFMR